jgi:acetyl-CoA carboxylase biotin carboxylase subunit
MKIAEEIGYPIIIKATAGGGGKGIRIANDPDELARLIQMAQTEAQTAFGNPGVYLEKFITSMRHIEIQVMGDNHGNAIYFGERDCSIQRRMQKLIEEGPSPALTPETRKAMGEAAVAAAKAVNYCGAGTIEFIYDDEGNFYFMEMNTRIQVEHPITEMITGFDLIKEQIRVTAGEPLSIKQEDIVLNGWAIECRINAEDPDKNFMPCPGKIQNYIAPGGFGVRVDSAAFTGYTVTPFYDSMIAKLIVWAPTREEAISRMERALGEFTIEGIKTTIPFHQKVLRHEKFIEGDVTTKFLEMYPLS